MRFWSSYSPLERGSQDYEESDCAAETEGDRTTPSSWPLGRDSPITEVGKQPGYWVTAGILGPGCLGWSPVLPFASCMIFGKLTSLRLSCHNHEMGIIIVPLRVTMRMHYDV